MCGIFGHLRTPRSDIERSRRALHTLTHRGPDQWSEWMDDHVYLGHRRLSILDLSENGRQPMLDPAEEVALTVNGEIYNFRELRSQLEGRYQFRSGSDSEVLLHGYREWGIDGLLQRIDGMYAFTIYDRRRRKLFLARDRAGIKPLYHSNVGGSFIWASELKAITDFVGTASLEVDHTAAFDFLTYLYIPSPKTLYRGVFKLEPGHVLEVDVLSGAQRARRYWTLRTETADISLDDAAERLRELISLSVSEQMVSDVPVGFFLSGGLDSSTVVAEASGLSSHLQTFSIGFDGSIQDETRHAALVAETFGTLHQEKMLDASVLGSGFERMRTWYDEPFGDTSAFPTYLVSQFTRETCTVALTGDGGDEVFGGYKWYRRFGERGAMRRAAARLSRFLPGLGSASVSRSVGRVSSAEDRPGDDLAEYARLLGALPERSRRAFHSAWEIPGDYDDLWHFRRYYDVGLPQLTRLQYLDFHTYLPDDILTKVDRVSMTVSLEARVPLLSKALVEFVFSLPEPIRYWDGKLKGILKFAYRSVLPESILSRSKQGFSIPFRKWSRQLAVEEASAQEMVVQRLYPELLSSGIATRLRAAS